MADSHREEIAKLETLYANNPEGRVFTHLAEAYRKAGELGRAREILEDGLRRHSDYSSAHVVLGRVLADQGDPDGATAAFRRVLELDRHNLVALRSLGEISSGSGRTDEALHYYRELLSLDPSDERLRGTVRGLEERREAQAAAAAAPPEGPPFAAEEGPAFAEEPAPEPSAEPPAVVAGEPIPNEPEPADLDAETAVPPTPDAVEVEPPSGDFARPAEAFSRNWEEDVGIELEPMPGDLASLAGETAAETAGREESGEPAEPEWAVSGEWLGEPPVDPLASGLDLGIEGEEFGRVELPVSDLELTEPAGDDLTPFDMPAGSLDLAPDEPGEPTPFAVLDTADDAGFPPEIGYGAVGATEGFDIDVGPATPEFGGPVEFGESADAAVPPAEWTEEASPARTEGELVTETMAELYFAQGAYARAADVYRSLLRDRPGDLRLEQRLADAESLASPAEAASTFEEDAGEAWLEGVESAWTGGGGVAGGETTPYAWAEPRVDEAPAGPVVGEYFRGLLAWRPGAGHAVTSPSGMAPAEGEGESADAGEMAYSAAETEAPAYLPMDALEEQAGDVEATTAEPWGASEPVRPPELPEAASAAGTEEDGPDDDEDLEMFRSWLQSLRK